MATNLSPAVSFKENMVTNIIKSLPTSIGGYAGKFAWGPAFEIVPVGSEGEMLTNFYEPDSNNADDWFSARNFLDYAGSLKIVRVVGSTARNAYSFAAGTALNVLVLNKTDWSAKQLLPDITSAAVLAKYPGTLGNSIEVSIADSSTFEQWKYRNVFSTSGSKFSTTVTVANTFTGTAVAGTNTITGCALLTGKYVAGQVITETAPLRFPVGTVITAIVNSSVIQVNQSATASGAVVGAGSITTTVATVPGAPSTTRWVASQGGANDEVHVVVVDADGKITGTAGTVLEKWKGLSKASDAMDSNNQSNYYIKVVNDLSNWVWISALTPTRAGTSATNYNTLTGAAGTSGSTLVTFTGNTGTIFLYDPVYNSAGTLLGVVVGKTASSITLNTPLGSTLTAATLTFGTDIPRPYVTGTITSTLLKQAATNGATPVAIGGTSITFAAGCPAMSIGTGLYNAAGALVGTTTTAVTAGQVTAVTITAARATVAAAEAVTTTYCAFTTTTMPQANVVNGITVTGTGINGTVTVVESTINLVGTSTLTLSAPAAQSNTGSLRITYGNGFYPVGSGSGSQFGTFNQQLVYNMESGIDGYADIVMADFMKGYDLFADPAKVDVNNLIMGSAVDGANDGELARYCIESIAEKRMDCLVFHSPKLADVLNVSEVAALGNIVAYRQKFNNSTYAVMDTGWKYQYDRFNDTYRWVPLNADIAGLSAQVDRTNDPWWSFGGYNRGLVKNVVKLAFNPTRKEVQRDVLYPMGINPVVTEEGEGTVLLGDTTMTNESTLFAQIGVRKLFMVIEKAIGKLAKKNLFEFNDEITQTRFYNTTSRYLRDIQGRRGITAFKVICDSSVNTPIVVEGKRFVGKIYVKPNMSINWAELEFTAVGASVSFAELG